MFKYLPNFLTILRIVLVPLFLLCIYSFEVYHLHLFLATLIFVIAALSDYFDGMLARKYKLVTNFGKIFDPLADKILVISALITLMIEPMDLIHPIVFTMIVVRELAVTLLRNYYAKNKIIIPANMGGKIKTTFQLIGIISAFFYFSLPALLTYLKLDFLSLAQWHSNIILGFKIYFWLIGILTIITGWAYFFPKKEGE